MQMDEIFCELFKAKLRDISIDNIFN